MRACGGSLAALLIVVLGASTAHAGNDDTYFMSGEAALMSGAVVAVGQGAGMLWYNPAGLGHIDRSRFGVSVSGVAIQRRLVPDGLVLRLPDGETNRLTFDGSRATTIAPAAVYAKHAGPLTLGVGFFTSRDDVIRLAAADQVTGTAGDSALAQIDVDIAEFRYHIGGGAGVELLGGRLRLGAALFAVYDQTGDTASLATSQSLGDGSRTDVSATALDHSTRWGLAGHLGMQVQPNERLHFGLAFRFPILLLTDAPDNSTTLQAGTVRVDPVTGERGGGSTLIFEGSRPSASVGQLEPLRLMLGAGLTWGETRLGIGFDFSPSLQALDVRAEDVLEPEYLVARTSVWNVRAGALVPLKRNLLLGFGLFTDRSSEPTPRGPTDFRVDYYGGTAGIRFETPVRVAVDGEARKPLVFRTTLSARYAYGVGDTRGFRIDFAAEDVATLFAAGDLLDVRFHEVYGFLASSLLF